MRRPQPHDPGADGGVRGRVRRRTPAAVPPGGRGQDHRRGSQEHHQGQASLQCQVHESESRVENITYSTVTHDWPKPLILQES